MAMFADPTAHSSFLSTYLVRVLAYTAGMVAVLYLTAGLIKAKRPQASLTNQSIQSSSPLDFWKTVWQRFVQPAIQTKAIPATPNKPTTSLTAPILTAKQTLPLDIAHTAHVLDSADGRWLLVTGPTGTQLHALQGANHLDQGNRSISLEDGDSPKKSSSFKATQIPVEKGAFGPPDGWGRVATLSG